jgi:SPX domain protein involved in polyphosphate accumulation
MADDDVLRRIDRSLERIDQHMERGNQIFEDHSGFLRELTLRQERVFGAMIERLEEQGRAIRELTEQMTEQMREQRREFLQESRAQRAALFRMLDRLDGGADPAGA